MNHRYIVTTTHSVTVQLSALEKHLDAEFLDILRKELCVGFILQAHVQADFATGGITFYTLQTVEAE